MQRDAPSCAFHAFLRFFTTITVCARLSSTELLSEFSPAKPHTQHMSIKDVREGDLRLVCTE